MAGTVGGRAGRQKQKTSLQWQLQTLTQKEGIFRKDLRELLKGPLRDLSVHWKVDCDGTGSEIQRQLQAALDEALRNVVSELHKPYAARGAVLFQAVFRAGFNLAKTPTGRTKNLAARKNVMVSNYRRTHPNKRGLSESTFQRYLWHAIEHIEKQILATGFMPQVPVSVFEKVDNDEPTAASSEAPGQAALADPVDKQTTPRISKPDTVFSAIALKRLSLSRSQFRTLALALVGAALFFIAASGPPLALRGTMPVQAGDDSTPGWADCVQQRRCFEMASGVVGSVGVANVTAGATRWQKGIEARYDQEVQTQLYYVSSYSNAPNMAIKVRFVGVSNQERTWYPTWEVTVNGESRQVRSKVTLDRDDARLVFVPGSVNWRHNVAPMGAAVDVKDNRLADAVVLAPSHPLETLRPGYDYAGTLTAKFRVQIAHIAIVVRAQSPANGNWLNDLYASPGAVLRVAITIRNDSNVTLYGLVVTDSLPPGATNVAGSISLGASEDDVGRPTSDGLVGQQAGLSVGTLAPGQTVVVHFRLHLGPKLGRGDELRNVGLVKADGLNWYYNTLVIRVE